jgi:hypothetical protein
MTRMVTGGRIKEKMKYLLLKIIGLAIIPVLLFPVGIAKAFDLEGYRKNLQISIQKARKAFEFEYAKDEMINEFNSYKFGHVILFEAPPSDKWAYKTTDLTENLKNLLQRTLEYVDPDKELKSAISLIQGCQEDPKKVIERYIKAKQLRADIEEMLEELK